MNDEERYAVVKNHEDQYSIWLAETDPPAGWQRVGFEGVKAECLEHIRIVWTDMTPASLRRARAQGD